MAKQDNSLNEEGMTGFKELKPSDPDYNAPRLKDPVIDKKTGKFVDKSYTLQECKDCIQRWLRIEDNEVIDVVFAFTLSEKIPGDPLWLFLIAPPGGAKTEILRAIKGLEYYHLSDLTSKSFISGLMVGHGENRRKTEDLLPQLNGKILIFKDFTTILEKNKDERREIISQFREIYDGSLAKKFGTMDEKVEHNARFGFIAGVTPIIDKHWKIMQQLGERFLKYRWSEDEDKVTRNAERVEGMEKEMRKELGEAVRGFLKNLEHTSPKLEKKFSEPLIQAAKFLAKCRTPVTIRGNQSDFFFDFIPLPEMPTRLVKQLKKLARCLAIVRSHKEVKQEDIDTAVMVALHTCPQDRLEVLKSIRKKQHITLDGCTAYDIRKDVHLPETSIRHILQQLLILHLIEDTKIARQTGSGWNENVTYYKLNKKLSAQYPSTFLEASKKMRGDSAPIWEEKAAVHLKNCSIQGCDNSPTNEWLEGKHYCREHWNEGVKQTTEDGSRGQ